MDQMDKSILLLLEENARMTVSEISKRINLSVSAVSERLKKLENTGIIEQYTTIINSKYLNKNLTAFMSIALEGPHYVEQLKDFVEKDDEILEGYYIAGEFDYMVKIITEDTESLKDILDRIKGIQGIGKTKTIVALSNIKNKHSIIPK